MLSSTLTALLDSSLNTWLALDEESSQRLEALAGKVICLHITGLEIKLYFFPSIEGIYTLSEYAGTPDVTLIAPPISLMRLSMSKNSGKHLLESDVRIEGSIGLSEKFSHLLSAVDLDWEEWLSHVVGDIVAYQTGESVRRSQAWLHESHHAMKLNTSEYLQEESRILPADAEVAYYLDQVDALRADAERLEARVQRLQRLTEEVSESS
jgi:ubiquinone biosynthesis protein UbiJ